MAKKHNLTVQRCIVCGENIWWDDAPDPCCDIHDEDEFQAALEAQVATRIETGEE